MQSVLVTPKGVNLIPDSWKLIEI